MLLSLGPGEPSRVVVPCDNSFRLNRLRRRLPHGSRKTTIMASAPITSAAAKPMTIESIGVNANAARGRSTKTKIERKKKKKCEESTYRNQIANLFMAKVKAKAIECSDLRNHHYAKTDMDKTVGRYSYVRVSENSFLVHSVRRRTPTHAPAQHTHTHT